MNLHKKKRFKEPEHIEKNLSRENEETIKRWSNVGQPGPAPTTPYVPSDEEKSKMAPISTPRRISIAWKFSPESFEKLHYGHKAHEMEDKWNIFLEEDFGVKTVHFHRSWTGMETFSFSLIPKDDGYKVEYFVVEQDPKLFTLTDDTEIVKYLSDVLNFVLGVDIS